MEVSSLQQENGGGAPSYAEAFPPLMTSTTNGDLSPGNHESGNAWPNNHNNTAAAISKITPIKQSVATQMFEIPYEERRYKDNNGDFGAEQSRLLTTIQNDFDVHIELHNTHNKGLTVLVTGRHDFVVKASAELRKRLQTPSSMELTIPQEYHRFLVGKGGATLANLKEISGCDIILPRSNSKTPDIIKIMGPKDNLDKARHEIHCIYDEMSRKATEVLNIPKDYHPFIAGPHNSISEALMKETGTRINIPPFHAQKECTAIRVSGEKEAVAETCRRIRKIYDDVRHRTHTVSIEIPKLRHRFVIGPKGSGLHDILACTGVSVEVPNVDDPSESIVLRGESAKLGLALTKVYEKAESMAAFSVPAPAWSHRRIIGTGGENLQTITAGHEKVITINFLSAENKISIEGPKEEAEIVHQNMIKFVNNFLKSTVMVEIPVAAKFHRNVIGKGGSIIKKIREDTGCTVRVPGTGADAEDVIRIEGEPKQVEIAKKELMQLVSKLENEKTKDLIIEQKFHRPLIGNKGVRIAEIRDHFPDVIVKFPDANAKSDIVQLRGPKDSVTQVEKALQKNYKDLKENSFEAKVKIFKEYHKDIIGKKGLTISKIRDETKTRIILPDSGAKSDVITVIGKEKDVNKAVRMIEEIQNQVAQITEEVVQIPPNVHQSIIGPRGAFIRAIQDQHHVHIHFPPSDSQSDRVTVRGNKSDLKAAVKALLQIAQEKKENCFQEVVRAKPEFHRFLIGRSGANIEQMRKQTGAKILFPEQDDTDKDAAEQITIVGTKEACQEAKKLLEARIKALEDTIEESIDVDKKWHREFMERRGYYVNKISNDCGGVRITFPKDPESSKVILKGPKDCVQDAKAQIKQIVEDMAARVTIEVVIPAVHHRAVIGQRGNHVRDICDKFDVKVNFPAIAVENGNGVAEGEDEHEKINNVHDTVTIAGKPEQCELAKEALLALVPITEYIDFPLEFHGALIGRGGEEIRGLSNDYNVNISIPKADNKEAKIIVVGVVEAVEKVKTVLTERLAKFEEEKADREARSYQVEVSIPFAYHRQIIGPKGVKIKELQTKFSVYISFPKPEDENDTIKITGYKDKAEACLAELTKLSEKLQNQTTAELVVISRVHPMIIGQRGKNLRELMTTFDVEIEMPGRNSPEERKDTIRVTGSPSAVDDACDHILGLAGDIIDRMIENGELDPRKKDEDHRGTKGAPKKDGPGFMVRDAPWNQELTSDNHFPAIGQAPDLSPNSSWGGARKLNHK